MPASSLRISLNSLDSQTLVSEYLSVPLRLSGEPLCPYTLITCLDSQTQLSASQVFSPRWLARHSIETIQQNLLVQTTDFLKLLSSTRLLFGFDMLWFLNEKPLPSVTLPKAPLVAPFDLTPGNRRVVFAGMRKLHCPLAVGGGSGSAIAFDRTSRLAPYVLLLERAFPVDSLEETPFELADT